MAADLPDVVERFVADVGAYVRDLERAAREADHFGDTNEEARERVRRFGQQAEDAAERAARAQREAAREAERLANGTGDMERAARAAARAQRELERAQMAQTRAAREAARQTDNEAEQYRELARQAARAAAEQQLLRFRSAGQFRQHNELLRRLTEQYGDFGDEFNRTFQMMESRTQRTAGSMSSLLGKIPLPLQAGLLALPLAAAVAAGAIVLAVGGALSAVAIMAAAKSKTVQKEFDGLKKHVVSSVKEWAKPWEDTLSGMIGYARDTFDDLSPYLKTAFADMAPAVKEFSGQVIHSLGQFGPMISKFSTAFRAMLTRLGPAMDDLIKDLADGLGEIADAVQDNPEAFAEFARNLGTIAKAAGYLIGLLTRLEQINRLLPSGLSQWRIIGEQWDGLTAKARGFSDRALVMNGVIAATGAATDRANSAQSRSQILMALASQSADKLKASLDNLSGKTLSAREAAANYGTAVLAMNKSLKDNGRAHGFATAKGIQNEQALNTLAQAAQDNAVAMRDNGASARDVAKYMERARKKFVESAVAAGYSRGEANKLADRLYGVRNAANSIPKKKHTKVTADTKEAKSTVERFKDWVGRQVARINISSLWPFAQGGPVPAFADGGQAGPGIVRGPGTGTSDSILARLSNGEFVMTAAATRMFGPLLTVMNKAATSSATAARVGAGQDVRRNPGIRRGGVGAIEDGRFTVVKPKPKIYAQLPRAAAPASVTYVTSNHYTVQGSVWAENELFSVLQREAAKNNARNPGLAQFGGR